MNFNISWWCVVWPCWSVRIYVYGYFHFLSRSGLRSHIHSLFAVTKEGSTDFIIPYHSVESCHSYCRLFSPYSDCDVMMMSLCIPWYRYIFFHSENHAYNHLKWIRSERSLMAHAGHQRIVLRVSLQATGWTGIIWFIWKRSNWYGVDTVYWDVSPICCSLSLLWYAHSLITFFDGLHESLILSNCVYITCCSGMFVSYSICIWISVFSVFDYVATWG